MRASRPRRNGADCVTGRMLAATVPGEGDGYAWRYAPSSCATSRHTGPEAMTSCPAGVPTSAPCRKPALRDSRLRESLNSH